jgi:hypothetical protein
MRWSELTPEPAIVAALDHAGRRPPANAEREPKKRWSELFAHACAVAFADAFRISDVRHKSIKPESLTVGTEPLTPLGSHTDKRIDVTVVDRVLGLEIGLSLKGLNFPDGKSGNYDKNMTGRLYEMGDEVRVVHEHLPHAFMVGVFSCPWRLPATRPTGRHPPSRMSPDVCENGQEGSTPLWLATPPDATRASSGSTRPRMDPRRDGASRASSTFAILRRDAADRWSRTRWTCPVSCRGLSIGPC